MLFIFILLISESKSDAIKPQIYVVNYPLQYFTERIGKDLVDVHFPVPDNVDPAFWVPSRVNIKKISKCRPDFYKWS